jgi:NADPH-dependent glutamate synthase beta subunit-like oxidoreductase
MSAGSGRGVLNYTTTIDAGKTAAECVALLARHGASRVSIDYAGGDPQGIAFSVDTRWGMRFYTLPANAEGVFQALGKASRKGNVPPRYVTQAQAAKVAWRILKDWLEAQLAMINAQIVELERVMLPYMVVDEVGTTAYDKIMAGRAAELEA